MSELLQILNFEGLMERERDATNRWTQGARARIDAPRRMMITGLSFNSWAD